MFDEVQTCFKKKNCYIRAKPIQEYNRPMFSRNSSGKQTDLHMSLDYRPPFFGGKVIKDSPHIGAEVNCKGRHRRPAGSATGRHCSTAIARG